jgi:superfamily II DNA or RNA helicase
MMKSDTVIRKSPSWAVLFQRLTTMTAKDKGNVFERVVQLYLQTHAEYESLLANVWMLGEVPNRVRTKLNLPENDEGIDLIAETTGKKYWAIQAKFRSNPNIRLTNKGDLATFTALAFHTCNHIDYGLICATTSQPLKKVELTGDKTGFRLFSDFAELDDDNLAGWKRLKSALSKAPTRPKKLNPMWHQKKAIKNASTHFIEEKQGRGKMIMPCGTGKSLTGFWIAQEFDAKLIVVAVPSLALVKQTLNVWTREYLAHNVKPEWRCVCSDTGSGDVDADEFTAHTYDLGVPCTTDAGEIAAFLKKRTSTPRIVFTTYQSGRVLAEAARKANISFDLGIMDEAHKTVGRKDKMFSHLLYEKNVKIKKRLFMTATERQFIGSSDEIASMDDPDIYGETFELLTFKEAIEAKQPIICDYKFVTIGISEQEIRDLWNDNKYLRFSGDELDKVTTRSLAAGLALRKAYTKFNVKRAISFHGSIRKAETFMRQQKAITKVFTELAEVECHHVSSKIPTSKRATILRDFAASERGLITNARCLTEGVDIPSVDCVLFADPRRSAIDIVQAAGRAMRKAEGKKFGYVIVPMIVPDDVDIDEFAEGTEFKEIVRTIRPLAINDDRIVEYFRAVSEGRKPKSGGPIVIDGAVKLPQAIDEAAFVKSIKLKVWGKVAKISWRPFEEARQFVHTKNISSRDEWAEFVKTTERPLDIPVNPPVIYTGNGWRGYGDWFGTGTIAPQLRKYRSFNNARDYARSLRLKNSADWRAVSKAGQLPSDIPTAPDQMYKDDGWSGMGDWLGTGVVALRFRKYRSFREARNFVVKLNLESRAGWRAYVKSGQLPTDIPSAPDQMYKDAGWSGMGDWLGTGTIAPRLRKYRLFNEARSFVAKLNLASGDSWTAYIKSGQLPSDIPTNPNITYRDSGWSGMGDWLGTDTVATRLRQYRSFKEARTYVQSLKLKSNKEWRAYAKSGKLPADIPANPNSAYKKNDWQGYGDWLGTGYIAGQFRKYRSFIEARDYARSLKLKNTADWRAVSKAGQLPPDIPTAPDHIYKDDGWSGMGDWLGTGYIAPLLRRYRSFEEARNFTRSLKLKSTSAWLLFVKSGNLPPDIPSNPNKTYKNDGWSGMGDWLG